MALPVNFEEMVRRPPASGGGGYPFSIKAADLMENFRWCDLQTSDTPHESGLRIVIEQGGAGKSIARTIKLDGELESTGSGLPDGSAGDMLYHDGTTWVALANPGAPSSGTIFVLSHSGTAPFWKTLTEQEVDICISGTPTTVTIYKE